MDLHLYLRHRLFYILLCNTQTKTKEVIEKNMFLTGIKIIISIIMTDIGTNILLHTMKWNLIAAISQENTMKKEDLI